MDHLWTPWRFQYLSTAGKEKDGCILCRLLAEKNDRTNLILSRNPHTFLVLNRFPYTTGHLMLVTRRHVPTLVDASREELTEIALEAKECERVLREVYRPDGLNVGFNIGRSAGAGVAGHIHLHIVPRWEGDANFVSVVGQTRVIPEDLEVTYDKLAPHFSSRGEGLQNHSKR